MELKIDNASIEKLVQEQIRIAVGAVLSKQSDQLVSRLVDHALGEKRNSYDRETILEGAINKMIRDEAQAAVAEWLDAKRPEIRKMVHAGITKKDNGLAQKIAEQLVAGLSSSLNVRTWLESKER